MTLPVDTKLTDSLERELTLRALEQQQYQTSFGEMLRAGFAKVRFVFAALSEARDAMRKQALHEGV